MKKKYLFGLILLSSCFISHKKEPKAFIMRGGKFVVVPSGKPVINKNLDNVVNPRFYSNRKKGKMVEGVSGLLYDTSHLTGSNSKDINAGAGSISYFDKGNKIILVSDPGSKNMIRVETNPKNMTQSTYRIPDVADDPKPPTPVREPKIPIVRSRKSIHKQEEPIESSGPRELAPVVIHQPSRIRNAVFKSKFGLDKEEND